MWSVCKVVRHSVNPVEEVTVGRAGNYLQPLQQLYPGVLVGGPADVADAHYR